MITTDLLLSPFGASGRDMVEAARAAESAGFSGIWTEDHFSASMLGRAWSHEPFTVLGAIAAATSSIRLGPLVVNTTNRHPARIASAAGSLQSLSGGRAVLGMGSGAAPGTLYAGEYDAIGVDLDDVDLRRRRLIEAIEMVKLVWAGTAHHEGEFFTARDLHSVVPDVPRPEIIVGTNSAGTAELGATHADGVNVVGHPGWEDVIRRVIEVAGDRSVETSVYHVVDLEHPLGGDVATMLELGVDRRVLGVPHPYPLDRLDEIARRIASV